MAKATTDHIRLLANDGVRGDQVFICERCGERQRVALPIPVNDWVKLSESFVRRHRRCLPAIKPAGKGGEQ